MDEQEMDRIDMSHAKYYMLLDKKRFLAPIPDHPQKILELGCGTGIWSIDIADEYPSAEVHLSLSSHLTLYPENILTSPR